MKASRRRARRGGVGGRGRGLAVLLRHQRGPGVPGVLRVRGGWRGAAVALRAQLRGLLWGRWLSDGALLEGRGKESNGERREEKRGEEKRGE